MAAHRLQTNIYPVPMGCEKPTVSPFSVLPDAMFPQSYPFNPLVMGLLLERCARDCYKRYRILTPSLIASPRHHPFTSP